MQRHWGIGGIALGLLTAAGGLAEAQAAQPFSVLIGGDTVFEAGFVTQDRDAGLRSTDFVNRTRITIDATAKSDNGLAYGAHMRLRAAGGNRLTDTDEAFIHADGSFGRVMAGVVNGPSGYSYVAMQTPIDWRVLALTNQPVSFIGGGATGGATTGGVPSGADVSYFKAGFDWPTFDPVEGEATKLVYFSPRFAGFQVALSYGPRSDSYNTDVNRAKRSATGGLAAGAFQDVFEAGLNYSATHGPVKVQAFGDFIGGKAVEDAATGGGTAGHRNLRGWHAGGQISVGGFAVGLGYLDTGTSGISKAPGVLAEGTRLVTVGGQYTSGPLVVGAQFQRGQDAGNLTVAGRRSLDMVTAGALYALAPGLQVGGEYTHFTANSDVAGRDDRGQVVLLHSILSF